MRPGVRSEKRVARCRRLRNRSSHADKLGGVGYPPVDRAKAGRARSERNEVFGVTENGPELSIPSCQSWS